MCKVLRAHTHTESGCYSALERLPVSKRPATHTEFFKHTLHSGVDVSTAPSVSASLRTPAQQPPAGCPRWQLGCPGLPCWLHGHTRTALLSHPSVPGTAHACVLPLFLCSHLGFPGSSDDNESARSAGDPGLIPGSGRSSGEGNGSPLQCSCL